MTKKELKELLVLSDARYVEMRLLYIHQVGRRQQIQDEMNAKFKAIQNVMYPEETENE